MLPIEIKHLYHRAGFGIDQMTLQKMVQLSREEIVDQLFDNSVSVEKLEVNLDYPSREKIKAMSKNQRQAFNNSLQEKLIQLNLDWIAQLSSTKGVLREKMALFWHNHFACGNSNPILQMRLNNSMRTHALGDFRKLLNEVSKSPAMILYLNNQQNKKSHPNENFGREVMELFTLGRDNGYTEEDIKEAARAFTGWASDEEGQFLFRSRVHDFDEKTFLGETGNFTGEEILKILCDQKQTARYVVSKIYKDFVNPKTNPKIIDELTNYFIQSKLNIEELMRYIFKSDWFYDTRNIGVKIKSPIELLVGINRLFNLKYEDKKVQLMVQKLLNQILFYPPNVAGWPGDRHWIDNSTLMLRLKLASIAINSGLIGWYDKGDMPEAAIAQMEVEIRKAKGKIQKKFKAIPDWNHYEKGWNSKVSNQEVINHLLMIKPSAAAEKILKDTGDDLKQISVQVMSLPEYQLC